jgi:membrane protein
MPRLEPLAGLGWRQWRVVIARVAASVGQNRLNLISAGIAFFAMLAVFPAIGAVIAIYSYVADPAVILDHIAMLAAFVPEEVHDLLTAQMVRILLSEQGNSGLAGLIGLGFAMWSARAGVAALIDGVAIVHGGAERRSFFAHLGIAFMLTGLLVGVVLVALAAVVITPAILAFLALGPYAEAAVQLIRWAVAITAIIVGIGALYQFGPRRAHRASDVWITHGAVTASLLWIAGSVAFSQYLSNFGNYNEVYGSLGAVIALIMWFFVSAFAVLLGAALDVEIATVRNSNARSEPAPDLSGSAETQPDPQTPQG